MGEKKEPISKYMAFYPSFREVIDSLQDDEKRLKAYDMFTDFGLYGIEPSSDIDHDLLLIFIVAKPNIQKFAQDLANGCKGGRPKKTDKETPVKTPEKTMVKTKKDKEKEREKEKETDISFSPLNIKEGDASPPSAGAGGEHPSLTDCQECADEGKVNLSEAGIKAFYNRMEKDSWKIKGEPVENLLKAMRGFAKNHKRYQKQGVSQERLQNTSCIKYFKPWLQHHGYDQNYTEGSGAFDAEILVQEDIISTVFDNNEIAESMYNINERLKENGFTNETIKPLMKLFKKYCAEKEGKS